MYNEPRHIVSVFKDYLIFDDFSEYLKRVYTSAEVRDRIPRILAFYEKYSRVYPNYVALPIESAFMFKNIERKQNIINTKNRRGTEERQKEMAEKMNKLKGQEKLFDSEFIAENATPPEPSESDYSLAMGELMLPPPIQSRASKIYEGPGIHTSL